MGLFVAALFPPSDPVVAVHESPEETSAALDFLGRAGYPSHMLKVVAGQPRECTAAPASTKRPAWHLPTSGMFWGALWSGFAVASAALVASHTMQPGTVILLGALALAIQTRILHSSVAPEPVTRATWVEPGLSERAYARDLAAKKILLLVSGSRSDIALARTLLRMREGAVDAA